MSRRFVLAVGVGTLVTFLACTAKQPQTSPSTTPTSASPTPSASSSLHACVQRNVQPPEGQPAVTHPPSPRLTPSTGGAGSRVTIEGTGMTRSKSVDVVAEFGGDNCELAGVAGTALLGRVKARADGSYALSVAWPATFMPYYGTEQIPKTNLPAGNYYVFGLPCSKEPCQTNIFEGSSPALFILR